jgi:hypothetical protein
MMTDLNHQQELDTAVQYTANAILSLLHQLAENYEYDEPRLPFELVWIFMAEQDYETTWLFRDTAH